jgi:hypothetical protein
MKHSSVPLTIALIALLSCSMNYGHARSVADTLIFCTSLGNAELPPNNQYFLGETDPDATACSVHLWTTQDVSASCGDSIRYDVRLYLFDGPGFVQIVEPAMVALDSNQMVSLLFDTRINSLPPDHPVVLTGLP